MFPSIFGTKLRDSLGSWKRREAGHASKIPERCNPLRINSV
jgi:hypothetical protein